MASEKTSPALVTLSVAVPYDLAEWVRETAEAERRSVSNWLKILIIEAKENDGPEAKQRGPATGS